MCDLCSCKQDCGFMGGQNTPYDCTECAGDDFRKGFEHGARWADENTKSYWIDVNEDLPHMHTHLLVEVSPYNGTMTYPVLSLKCDGEMEVCQMFLNDKHKWEWSINEPISYWMPIPKIQED